MEHDSHETSLYQLYRPTEDLPKRETQSATDFGQENFQLYQQQQRLLNAAAAEKCHLKSSTFRVLATLIRQDEISITYCKEKPPTNRWLASTKRPNQTPTCNTAQLHQYRADGLSGFEEAIMGQKFSLHMVMILRVCHGESNSKGAVQFYVSLVTSTT